MRKNVELQKTREDRCRELREKLCDYGLRKNIF